MLKKIVMGSLMFALVGALVLGAINLTARPVGAAPVERRGAPGQPTDRVGNQQGGQGLLLVEPGVLDQAEVNALVEALNDEHKALATYQKVVDTFGAVQPFASIMRAEQQHIAALERLFARYGVEIPVNDWYDQVPAFDSVAAALAAGIHAEIDNAALYGRLFAAVDEPDIVQVFTRLRDASQYNHLPAFQMYSD